MTKHTQQIIWTSSNGGEVVATFIKNKCGKVDSVAIDATNVLVDPEELKELQKFFLYAKQYKDVLNLANDLFIDFAQTEVKTNIFTKEEKYQEHLQKVKENPFHLRYIPKEEQTEDLCLAAVRQNGWALEYAQQQTEEICLEAVRKDGLTLQYVQEQTEAICLAAVCQEGLALQYVQQQTEEICLEAVRQNGWTLKYVKEQTPELCLEAVRQSGGALKYVKGQTKEICLEAVRQNGFALEYIQQQTEEICLEAVRQNGWALGFVQQQTEEICLEAVRQEGYALKYAKNPFKELCVAAIKQNPCALEYIPQKWKEEVARKAGMELFYCENRTVLVEKIDHQWVFTVGCQVRISKETFIQRIHEEDGGLAENPHRQEYLDILEQF